MAGTTTPRWRDWALLLAAAAYLFALYYFEIGSQERQIDFGSYYVWGFAARHGLDPYGSSVLPPIIKVLQVDAVPANYPPLVLLAFEPLSLLPVRTAFWIWSGTNFALLLTSIAIMIRYAGERGSPVAILALALLYGPITDELYWGESDLVVMLLIAISLRAIRRSSDMTCGMSLALAALWKAFPAAIFVGFISDRRPRLLLAAAFTLLVGAAVSVVVFGPGLNLEFAESAWRTGSSALLPYSINWSFAALITRGAQSAARAYPGAPWPAARLAAILLVEVLVFLLAVHGASIANRSGRPEFAFALWVAWLVPLLTVVWFHRLTFFLVFLLLLARADGTSTRARCAGLISYGLAEIGLVIAWTRWLILPAHDELTQNGLGAATFLAMVFGFSAAYLMCVDSDPAFVAKAELEVGEISQRAGSY
jgi:hypothetical protein